MLVCVVCWLGVNPIYGQESWRNLADSIRDLSAKHTVTFMSTEIRGDGQSLADFISYSSPFLQHTLICRSGPIELYRICTKA